MAEPASDLRGRYAAMSDTRLLEVLRNPDDYRKEAYAIAVEVGTERGLYPLAPESQEEPSPFAKPGLQAIDVEEVPQWMLAVFVLLPFIGGIVNMVWYMALHEGQRDPRIGQTMSKILWGVGAYILVYLLLW